MTAPSLLDPAPDAGAMPVVIGLDLSLTASGYAGPDGTRTFKSTGHKGDPLDPRARRLDGLRSAIVNAAVEQSPDLVVVEAPSIGQTSGDSAMLTDRCGLWWLIVADLWNRLVPVLDVPPKSLKKYVTGNGNAGKNSISMHLLKRFGVEIDSDNEADAFGLRAIGLHVLGHPLADMPLAHLAALERLPRPAVRSGS